MACLNDSTSRPIERLPGELMAKFDGRGWLEAGKSGHGPGDLVILRGHAKACAQLRNVGVPAGRNDCTDILRRLCCGRIARIDRTVERVIQGKARSVGGDSPENGMRLRRIVRISGRTQHGGRRALARIRRLRRQKRLASGSDGIPHRQPINGIETHEMSEMLIRSVEVGFKALATAHPISAGMAGASGFPAMSSRAYEWSCGRPFRESSFSCLPINSRSASDKAERRVSSSCFSRSDSAASFAGSPLE
ncbi:hypothetical protein [Bradyrhizobium diazoefficiens]|uniref:hypothetical protein n=1 Tax=Bradyrhizobium diazoefficiens TaxID=1355477 RepID=UPI003836ABD4